MSHASRGDGRRLTAAAGALLLLAAAGCGDSPAKPVPVASVSLTPSAATVIAGTTQILQAAALDAKGATLTGRPFTWQVTPPSVAVITQGGVVTAVSPGTATATASSEGKVGSAVITVIPVPVATVSVTPSVREITIGATVQLLADPRDAMGNPLVGRVVTWTTSAPNVATVGSAGLVTGIATGTALISASSEGVSTPATITVRDPNAVPTIENISPPTLVPGTSGTITGTGFAQVDSMTLTVGGAPARIQSVNGGQLQFMVPCAPTGVKEVRLTVRGLSVARPHGLTALQRTLTPGSAFITTSGAESPCNELVIPAGGTARFLVAVFSASTALNTLVDFALEGNPAAAMDAPVVRVPPPNVAPTPFSLADITPAHEAAHDRAHGAMLERERALFASLMQRHARSARAGSARAGSARAGSARAGSARATSPPSASQRAAIPVLGDQRNIYFTFTGGCNDTTRVMPTRAIRVGTRSVIWEDTTNTLRSTADPALAGYYQRLGEIFDTDQYDAVKTYFGDPLLRDGVTDLDGKVHMVFSQRLNGTGAAAYVTSCDQFPTLQARGSNFGEVFYGFVPTASGSNLGSTTFPDGWFHFMARTVVHEVKHIASMAARVANGASQLEQGWLEEGTARHAEEVWVRDRLHRVAWKGNTGFGTAASNGVFCDFHADDATCNAADPLRRPGYGMRRHFNEIREKLVEPWTWSPYGTGTGQGGSVFYQTTWSLVRYAIDRFGVSDAAFLTDLTNSTAVGVTNLSTVAGAPIDRIVGGWGLALYADDYPGLAAPSPDVQFPTWNLRSIYQGLNASPAWVSRWNVPYPVAPTPLAFGSFSAIRSGLRGGSHYFFELAGTGVTSQVLSLRGPAGSDPSGLLRVAVVRLQ